MVKQFAAGKIVIPCMTEGDVYDVKPGSVRMYTQGSYFDGVNNATAVSTGNIIQICKLSPFHKKW